MPLLLTGKKFHNDLKTNKCLAIFAPLEGGYETRLLRRMRAKGFKTFITSARGLEIQKSSCSNYMALDHLTLVIKA